MISRNIYCTNIHIEMWSQITIIAITMLFLDAIYLATVGTSFSKMIQQIQGSEIKIQYISVVACYLLLVFGLYYFVVMDQRPAYDAFLLGVLIYGVYDTTNYATIRGWKWYLALIDTIWGGTLFYLTIQVVYLLK